MNIVAKRRARMIEFFLMAALGGSVTIPAFAAETHEFAVPAEDASMAIREFASQAQVQILVAGDNITGKQLHAVQGNYSTDQGLHLLLADSGLSPRYVGERSVALLASDPIGSEKKAAEPPKSPGNSQLRLAQANRAGSLGSASNSAAIEPSQDGSTGGLSEIIVSAQKKSERLQDVPVPVSVTDPVELIENNQTKLLDYFSKIPGLTLLPAGFGNSMVAIRGIMTGQNAFQNPSVSFVVDDVPYGASTAAGGGVVAPDVNPDDLARIEVLRGPQGTLYGSSTIGGTIKYVTIDPDTSRLSGHMQTGLSSIKNGDGLGDNFRGSINVPLSDQSALRASAYYQLEPGYVDNPITNERGVNRTASYGGRVAGLWNITDEVTGRLSATVQHIQADGANDLNPTLGDLKQDYLRGTNATTRDYQVYSATLDAKLGSATLKSITAYSINKERSSVDLSIYDFFGGLAFASFGVRGVPLTNIFDSKKFSQELRLEMALASNVDWLIGAFFTNERTPYLQQDLAANDTTGQVVGIGANFDMNSTYRSYAGFTDLTWHLTSQFDLQIGGRESFNRLTTSEVDTGPFIPTLDGQAPPYDYGGPRTTKDNAFTYLVTPRFKVSDELMIYARAASGFRSGGTNSLVPLGSNIPLNYAPDKTNNYELGIKASTLDNKLFIDASLYDIEWKKIQLTINLGAYQPVANGGSARSQGIELTMNYMPVQSTTLSGWVSYGDAKLTEDFPASSPVAGFKGDRLPYGARLSGNVGAENEFGLTDKAKGFVGASLSYTGDRLANFADTSADRGVLPSYARMDFHAGARSDDWTANFFVNNAADRRGRIDTGFAYYYVIQPRTLGVNLSKTF